MVVATDAPLLPHQLRRLARRAALGRRPDGRDRRGRIGRPVHRVLHPTPTGTPGRTARLPVPMLRDEQIDPLYEATVQATEEAIINAMLAART